MMPHDSESKLSLGLINKVDMVCLSPVLYRSEEQKETARSLILSGIEIHASITDDFHGLASFGRS